MTEKGFSELNLEELEVLASNWAQEYDVIEKITLYRGSYDSGVQYMLVAVAPPFPILDKETRKKLRNNTYLIEIDGEYVESISKDKYMPVPVKDSLVAKTIAYYNWRQTNCWHIKDALKLAYNDLESVYKQLELNGKHASEFIDKWMWFDVEPDEELPPGMVNNRYGPVPLYEKYKETATANLPTIIETDHPELQKHDNALYLFRDNWYVKYNGKSATIKNLKGMRYIAFLLDNPDSNFDPFKLLSLVGSLPERNEEYNSMSPEQLEKKGASLLELPLEDMTQEDKSKLEDTAKKLWKSSKSGNKVDIERWEECRRFFDREYGLFVYETKSKNELKFILKSRLMPDAERERKNISRAISTAISRIKASNCSDLAVFLSNKARLHKGNYFCYNSDAAIDWFIRK